MHELSLAMNIFDSCAQELENAQGTAITNLHLEVGRLSGVMVDSLRFALEANRDESVLKNAQISIDEIPAVMRCEACGHTFVAEDFYETCPSCGAFSQEIIKGKDLIIKSITIT